SFAFFSTAQNHGTAPTVALTSPVSGATFTQGQTVTLQASASDDGTVTMVRFYDDDMALQQDTTSPYQMSWVNPPLGRHQISASATDSQGFVTRSNAASVSILPAAGTGGIFLDGAN